MTEVLELDLWLVFMVVHQQCHYQAHSWIITPLLFEQSGWQAREALINASGIGSLCIDSAEPPLDRAMLSPIVQALLGCQQSVSDELSSFTIHRAIGQALSSHHTGTSSG